MLESFADGCGDGANFSSQLGEWYDPAQYLQLLLRWSKYASTTAALLKTQSVHEWYALQDF